MSASEARAATSPTFLDLPSPLPAEAPGEPEELRALRSGPIGDADFIPLRRRLREAEDWRSLAALLVLYAASIDQRPKIAELCGQAAELLLDRVKDRPAAAHALARLLQAQPDNERAIAQLEVLYAELDWPRERAVLMRLRIHDLERRDPSAVPAALTALAQLLEESFMAIREAILLYQRALARDPGARAASEALIRLYLNAGAWSRASELMQAELTRLDPAADRERFTALHLQLARIQAEEHDNVAAAALHLQAALKANPDDLRALRAFGVLYLGSGKASDEGLGKAADIFFRAAKLAHKQGDGRELLKLLRRTLSLRPDHYEAGTMLAEQLSAGERWTDLDDLYNRWLGFVDPDDAYDLWIQRGELLETHLARREEARVCYEAASRFEGPDGPAWRRLEELYGSLGDYEALVGLLEAHAEQQPDAIPTARLLRAAEIYRDELHNDERASYFFFKVLEREPFNRVAFEGYKEHWRRKNSWSHLRDLLLYQVDQAANVRGPSSPLHDPAFAEEFVELAEISERRLGDLDGALDAWQRMQAAYPNDYRPREPIARLEKRIRILDQLIQSQENELRRAHDPEQRLAVLRRLTQAYRERTIDPARAIDLLSELLTVAPDDANAEAALADLYRRVGDYSGLITILRQQYEAARRPAQQMALVRQMAEIWQDELQDNESAIWACDQLVGYRADDPEIHRRLAALYIATGRYDKLYQTLERELSVTTDARAKIPLLRRMASIAEARLADQRKAARVYADLLALDPHNLDVVDKIAAIYEHSELYQELAALLGKAAASGRTPPIRQLDYLMRLGHIAEDHLSDPDLACSAFEKVLRIHRDHRGAVEALTRIYRAIASWHGLGAMLGNLQELVDTDEEILQLGLERAEVLADHLDNAAAAARVLEQLQQAIAPGNRQINRRLLQLYTRAADHRRLVRHAEILLLAADDRAERRLLLERIAKTWVEHLGDPRAGLNAFARYTDEAGEDPEGLRILADLQELAGDHQAALRTLDRRLTLLRDPGQQIAVLEHMAELCEVHLQHYKRAMALLGKGLGIAPSHAGLRAKIVAFAGRHDMWKDLLHAYGERFGEMSQRADVKGQIELCMSASLTALEQIHDPGLAFGWAKKAYFVGVSAGPDARAEARAAHERLKSLAAEHGLWSDYLAVLDQEVQRARERGVLGDHASIEQLRAAAAIAKDQLRDPQRAIAYMRVAHQARPDDQDLARQIEALAEGNQLWSEQIAVHEERLARATSNLARFEAHAAIARILEKHVGDPTAAIARLRTLWEQLVGEEESLAEEALDLLVEIAEAHHRWPELADLRRAIARRHFAQGRRSDGLSALLAAATIEEQRAGDGLAALRTLRGGLGHDPGGALLLPRFRAIASDLDRDRPEGQPPLGALATLIALQDLIGASDDPTARIPLLGQRALLREGELHDPRGAATEWLRVLALAPQHDEARRELDRLAQREHLTELRLLLPSWEIQRLHGQRRPGQPPTPRHLEQEITLLHGLAELYEVALARPEYALRARLSAWRLRPSLPPAEGELPEPHRALWRLAAATGVYVTPPSPRDPLLHPHVTAPEHGDEQLILDPDHRPARAALEALAARVGEPRRLIAAYERIHGELTLPEHMVELSLHLAELYSREGEPARAEEHYRGVLAVVPQHIPALRALADLYAAAGQGRELVDVRTRLLDLEAPTLSEDARIAAVLGLSRDLERLHRYADAARRIEALAREQPERRELQERLAELLLRQDDHRAALDVLRGLYERSEGEARRALLIQIAELQQSKLADPEAAIATWERLHAEHPGDPAALTHLQELYLQTHRYQPLLAILDARLAAIPHGKSPARVPLLVTKARALQEGLGDQEGATLILEALAEEDPENDEVTLGLSRLYRRGGRFAEGIAILRDRLDDLDDEDHDIRSRISLALSEILENEAHDRDAAMLVIEEALAGAPDDYDLLQRRAVLARALADYPVVVDTLAQLGDPDGLLEAADLARTRLLDPDWAARLYSQVLSGADKHSADPDGARRLSAAIEGLVHLRLSAGDLSGADALISDQLATIPQAELRARILTELGRTLWRVTHDLSLARARFDAALREDPDYSAARLRLGEVLIEAGALAEAEPLLEEAVESFVLTRDGQHLAPALVLLAQIFEATDRSADAYRRLTSALRQDPDDLGIRAAIARNRHAAGRWRELLQAVEPVEAQLDGGKLFSGDDRRRAGELLLLAAAADAGLGDRSRQFARLERAAALTPEDPRPILQLQELARAAADPARAARYAAMLARTRPDPLERGRELVEAGMLHEAAALAIAEADEPAPDADARIEALRAGAFAALRDGLALLLDHPDAVVERRHLEVTFWVAAGRDPDAALACLDRLLVRDDLRPELRRDLLLEGAHIALQRRAEGDLERAYAYASHAIEGSPDLAAPIARMFDVLEAYGGDEAQETVERLVLGFFNEHGLRSHQGEAEDAARTALLIRLADTQNEHPSRAIRLLERAAALDLSGLGLRERHHLDRLYQAAGAEPAKIRKNLEAILALDPFDVASVSALADLCERAADLDQAHALYELLLAIEPEHPRAAAFLDAHELLLAEQGALDMVAIQEPPPPSAGLIEALSQLWKGAAAFVCERLPRLDVPEAAIIRDSDAAWYSTWGDVRARLSAPPYTLADGDALGERAGADLWIGPKCQYPPVMVLGPGAKQAPESTLRFAVGRALFFARPGNLLAAALAHDTQISLLAAFLQTYHPRHQRRRPLDDASAAIAQNLARKVPLKLAQQLGAILREHEHERFDSREWRAWVLHGGDRVGLCAAGELGAALDHLGLPLGAEARQGALQARRSEPGLRALLAFAGGRTYAAARHGLGFRVRPRGA
jgi:thioredoxin-like negative regulator of GroEL